MRSTGATTPSSITDTATGFREADWLSFVVPIIEIDGRGADTVRQAI
jgi:hypothetical protein